MRRIFLLIAIVGIAFSTFGQKWESGSDGKIYSNGGNVGIGTTNPNAKFEVGVTHTLIKMKK
mgnify:CR=1 FL=1